MQRWTAMRPSSLLAVNYRSPGTGCSLRLWRVTAMSGRTVIRNVGTLRVKETDRLAALAHELTRLGATVEERPSGLAIDPPERVNPLAVDTYNDHRMAMAFSLAGLRVPGLEINDPGCCAKTFPGFFDRFGQMTAA